MRRLPVLIALATLASIQPVNEALGQPKSIALSLQQAQEYAITNNLTRKNAAIDVEIARKKVWETTAQGLPQVNAGIDFQYILNDLPKLTFPGQNGQPVEIEVGEKANATYSLSVSQLVFNGPYIVGLQASRAFKNLSENALAKTDQELKAGVTSGYLTTLLLKETTAILDSNVASLKKILKETQALQANGFADKTAVNQVNVSLLLVENSAAETRKQFISVNNLLKLQLGIPDSVEVLLTDRLDEMVNSLNPNAEPSTFDPNTNIDLKILNNQVKINELQLKLNKSYFLPSISAFVTFQRLHKEPQINFTPTALLGVKATIPIFSSGMRLSKVQQAKLEWMKSTNTYNQTLQQVEINYAEAKTSLSIAWSKYEAQNRNRELALQVLDEVKVKYSNGLASQTDVIQANDKYLQAVGNYLSAIVELINARVKIDKITGKL